MLTYAVLFFVFVFILGAVMGSFIGALVWRMNQKRDWVRERSECEHCHHQLSVLDLIPIISYVGLRGKCRYCHKPIGKTVILLELGTGLAFLLSALIYPSIIVGNWTSPTEIIPLLNGATSLRFGLWLVCLVLMIALFTYDLKWRLLPDKLVAPLVVVAFIYSAVNYLGVQHMDIAEWLANVGLGLLPITGVYGLLYLISGGRWIGFGDVKLGIAIGCLVPWWGGVIVLFLANILGSLVSLPGLISRKVKGSTEIAFGPFLITATILVVWFSWALTIFSSHK